jgi:hypothetical protein
VKLKLLARDCMIVSILIIANMVFSRIFVGGLMDFYSDKLLTVLFIWIASMMVMVGGGVFLFFGIVGLICRYMDTEKKRRRKFRK